MSRCIVQTLCAHDILSQNRLESAEWSASLDLVALDWVGQCAGDIVGDTRRFSYYQYMDTLWKDLNESFDMRWRRHGHWLQRNKTQLGVSQISYVLYTSIYVWYDLQLLAEWDFFTRCMVCTTHCSCWTNLIATAIFVIVSTILRLILLLSMQLVYLYLDNTIDNRYDMDRLIYHWYPLIIFKRVRTSNGLDISSSHAL